MAELIARSPDGQVKWRAPLPPGPVKLGRAPQPDTWRTTEWDPAISRSHAELHWDGWLLAVRCLDTALNPIVYNRETYHCREGRAASFRMFPGERFVIGTTSFDLVDEEFQSFPADQPAPLQLTWDAEKLRGVLFDDPNRRLEALAALPDLIRTATEDEALQERVLEVLLRGIPHASFAAVVSARAAPGGEPEVVTHLFRHRNPGATSAKAPSRRLTRKALCQERKTVGYVWDATEVPSDTSDFTVNDTQTDWAVCSPLPDEPAPDWGLYVSGKLPHHIPQATALSRPEVGSDFKFTFLTAEFYGALRQVLHLRRREAQMSMYFSPEVLRAISNQNIDEVLRRRSAEVAVLFCDLRGSCRIAEGGKDNLDPIWEQIGLALEIMSGHIIAERGVIGDFLGDAALGFWGWPFEQPDQVERVVRAALAIRRDFAHLARSPDHPLAGFACGLGLTYGPAIVGRLGTRDQFKLGVFGPVVNRAARFEGLTKRFGAPVLIDDEFARRLGPGAPPVRPLGLVLPCGFEEPVGISELLAGPGEPGGLSEEERKEFAAALGRFRDRDWGAALAGLRPLPDGPSEFLVRYMESFPGRQPPAGWDGVIRFDSK